MGINKVELATGEPLIDLSGDTVTSDLLAEGATAHDANGDPIPGTFPISEVDTQADLINQIKTTLAGKSAGSGTGGENVSDNNITVTFDMDISTISASNFSHTYDEIVALLAENKNILAKGDFGLGYCFGQLVAYNSAQSVLLFQIMLQFNFGNGTELYYFSLKLHSDNSITVNPYIVNTTSMMG